ncbi:MAG TPA: T9SS type A sorting domain-containing protein [Bacteroidia bacterium]|nr:T9SS type A sorting domain-containing protein [Bacteroidia bacterium]
MRLLLLNFLLLHIPVLVSGQPKIGPNVIPPEIAVTETVEWWTYLGGTNADEFFGAALTPGNGVIVVGRTQSTDFPVTANAMQDTLAGSYDACISRFDTMGNCLWSTYYGGTGFDGAYSAIYTDSGIIICGGTSSTDLPMMNAYQSANAGSYDAFLLLLNDSGQLIRSTYFGATGGDQAFALAIDTSGNIVIAGSSTAAGLPLASSGYQPTPAGAIDAFIAVFDLQLQPLWCTYYGGIGSEDIHTITVTPTGEIVFCGGTYSLNFPVTTDAYQGFLMGAPDVYMVRFGMDGTRHYATFLGGTSQEDCNAVVCDSAGKVYLSGFTFSSDFPIVGNSYQTTPEGQSEIFVACFDTAGQLNWSTYIGKSGIESAFVAYRYGKYLYIGGTTESPNFPIGPEAFQAFYLGNSDAFIIKMDTSGTMIGGTFAGGGQIDVIYGLVVTTDTAVYACATTYSNNISVTPGAFQETYAGAGDGYVLKFSMGEELITGEFSETVFYSGQIDLFPNPAADEVKIISEEKITLLKLLDLSGRVLFVRDDLLTNEFVFDIHLLLPGVYLVQIVLDSGVEQVQRLVKK